LFEEAGPTNLDANAVAAAERGSHATKMATVPKPTHCQAARTGSVSVSLEGARGSLRFAAIVGKVAQVRADDARGGVVIGAEP